MVELGIGLDVNTLPVAAVGIGVGIDYGIYLMSRICEEYQLKGTFEKAIFAAVGTTEERSCLPPPPCSSASRRGTSSRISGFRRIWDF